MVLEALKWQNCKKSLIQTIFSQKKYLFSTRTDTSFAFMYQIVMCYLLFFNKINITLLPHDSSSKTHNHTFTPLVAQYYLIQIVFVVFQTEKGK